MTINKKETGITEVKVLTVLGLDVGSFLASNRTLPQLVKINRSCEGGNYFRWKGMKLEEYR